MKRWLAALLALMMLCAAVWAAAEEGDSDFETDFGPDFDVGSDTGFGFDFSDDGYSGEWVEISPLAMEFCLPDDWTEAEPPEGAEFAATRADGAASMAIRLEDVGVEDLEAWGKANLDGYALDTASFYQVLVTRSDQALTARLTLGEGNLIAFAFTRESADALPDETALQIVGTACETWVDGDLDAETDEGEGFDFGAALESEE